MKKINKKPTNTKTMSEPILIPIKASEELPKDKTLVYTNEGEAIYDSYYEYWYDNNGETVYGILYWYKPVSEDEYKIGIRKELLNELREEGFNIPEYC